MEPQSIFSKLSQSSSKKLYEFEFPTSIVKEFEEYTGFGAIQTSKILGISKSKYYKLISEDKTLNPHTADTLASILRIWQKGIDVFEGDPEAFKEFLNTSNKNLGNIKPMEILNSETGRYEISQALDRIEHGLYG